MEKKDPDISYTTALAIIPSTDEWSQIQNIRKSHDKAFLRWMPHINLLYPFIPETNLPDLVETLKKGLADTKSFEVTLAQFQYFTHSRTSATVYLRPDTPNKTEITDLYKKIITLSPLFEPLVSRFAFDFSPHLSVGQWRGEVGAKEAIRIMSNNFTPIRFAVDKIYVVTRTDTTPFEIKYEIPLEILQ
jgi:2'-5' RNA ligase